MKCVKSLTRAFSTSTPSYDKAVIVEGKRTAMGSFGGKLINHSAVDLGTIAVDAVMKETGLNPELVEELVIGSCIPGGMGQNPVKRVAHAAGLSETTVTTLVKKVCASGMKALSHSAMAIELGLRDVVIAGGMESMTNAPFYLFDGRWGMKYGDGKLHDSLNYDGLYCHVSEGLMGLCADALSKEHGFTREECDDWAIYSYEKAQKAFEAGLFENEIIPIELKNGEQFVADEEVFKVKFDKIPKLRPVFTKDGTTTAANACPLSDGGNALVVMSESKANELGLKIRARILAYEDGETFAEDFLIAPKIAMTKTLERVGMTIADMDFIEMNEPFSVVPLLMLKTFGMTREQLNVNGSAVSMGHPLGSSGSRIVVTLMNVLEQNQGKYGLATLCNGGGGASAMVIERVD